jgi:DNA-directed RNA polymerase subunit RPC12/RpoP
MSSAFEPMSQPQNPASETAYRTTAALLCATCGTAAGDDHTFTKSGDVQCRACADRALHAIATDAAASGGDMAGERRCGCGGVASAGKTRDHVATQRYGAYGIGMVNDKIDMGSETVFSCASCGKSFALLNRLRRVRLVLRAAQISLAGVALGGIGLAILDGYLGWLAFLAIFFFVAGLGAAPLIKDRSLRRAHPPIG